MAYIGRNTDKISNIEVLDNITFDGSSSYSITKSSVAFVPNSAQSLLISIDGVVQATNFTVSSSTIDFGVAIPSTSTCDFFLHYGTGLITTPADGTVTTAKIVSNAVTTAKIADDAVTENKLSALANPFASQLLHVRKETSVNNDGASVVGDQVRSINTVVTNEISGASLSSNQITLPAGTFYIIAKAPFRDPGRNRTFLYNDTDSSVAVLGVSTHSSEPNDSGCAFLQGRFTITASKTFELQHYCSTANSTGLGLGTSDGRTQVYTDIQIWKVA
jgi:hypothetical protein